MQGENNHISFTAADIRKYHEGKLTPREMHALEKAALEDPFLADALEGYAADGVQLPDDTDELKRRLAERLEDKKLIPLAAPSRSFNWLKAAAMIVAIAGAGLLVYQLGFNDGEKNIAQTTPREKAKQDTPATVAPSGQDTAHAVASEVATQTAKAKNPSPLKDNATTLNKTSAIPAPARPAQSAPVKALRETESNALADIDNTSKTPAPKTDTFNFNVANGYADLQRNKIQQDEARQLKKEEGYGNASALAQARSRRNQAFLPNNIFRGKVTDAQNNPLPFANITNTRDNVGTYSDAQGNFVLTSPDSVMDVQVRSLGFENNNAQLQNGIAANKVTLTDDRSLTEVVISNKKINTRLRDGNMVLEEPEPADGWSNYDTYLANNLNVPENYKNKQSGGGEVELSFEVNNLGEPINIKVTKSLCEVCDKEAIRLLKEGPKWKRKAKKGRRTTVTIPF